MRHLSIAAGALALSLAASTAIAQEGRTIDESVNEIFANSTGWFVNLIFAPLPGTSFPWIVLWLVVGAVIFSVYFKFIRFRVFGHAIALVRGDYSDPNDTGEVSHFQALATALSGTVGLGNIAGVAVAVGIGGIKPIANVTGNIVPFMGMPTCSAGPGARASSERPFPTRPSRP